MDKDRISETEVPYPENQPGHETTDADVKPIVIFLVSLGVFIIVSMLAMGWYLDFMEGRHQAGLREVPPLTDQEQIPPEPRLQANPALEMEEMRVEEQELLNSYQWIDENTGTFRIPIERAIEIIAENGLPARRSTETPESTAAGPSEGQEGSR